MSLVLDNSVSIAWFVPDERNVETQRLLDRVIRDGALVPSLWALEVANALIFAQRRGRISDEHRAKALHDLADLPIAFDAETHTRAWGATLGLAERFDLTLYDACYLELAQRSALPLASLDRELQAAGRALGIELLGV